MNIKLLLLISLSFLTTTAIAGNNYQCISERTFGFQIKDNKVEPANVDPIKFIINEVAPDDPDFAFCKDAVALKSAEIVEERSQNEKIRNGIIITSAKIDFDIAISKKALCYQMNILSKADPFFNLGVYVCVYSEIKGIKHLDCPTLSNFNFSMINELHFYTSKNGVGETLKQYFKHSKDEFAHLFNAFGKCSKV